jgi:hypothetical protein
MSANGMVRPCPFALAASRLAGGAKRKEPAMSGKHNSVIAVIAIDIGKNSFHVVASRRAELVDRDAPRHGGHTGVVQPAYFADDQVLL